MVIVLLLTIISYHHDDSDNMLYIDKNMMSHFLQVNVYLIKIESHELREFMLKVVYVIQIMTYFPGIYKIQLDLY